MQKTGSRKIDVFKTFYWHGATLVGKYRLPELLPGQNIWNCTRNRVMAYYLQSKGFDVISVASWCDKSDFGWCFDGLPEFSSIAVSTNGCKSSAYGTRVFLDGIKELQQRKHPTNLIVCGREVPELERYSNIIYYPCFSQRWEARTKNEK